MKKLITILSTLVLSNCTNQADKISMIFGDVSPKGYTQRIEILNADSKLIYISGQVPIDAEGNLVGINDLEAQTDQVFRNIKYQIEQAGGNMDNIIKIDCYFTDISKISEFRISRDKFISLNNPPTSTAVQVSRLINTDFMIEINAVAVIKN